MTKKILLEMLTLSTLLCACNNVGISSNYNVAIKDQNKHLINQASQRVKLFETTILAGDVILLPEAVLWLGNDSKLRILRTKYTLNYANESKVNSLLESSIYEFKILLDTSIDKMVVLEDSIYFKTSNKEVYNYNIYEQNIQLLQNNVDDIIKDGNYLLGLKIDSFNDFELFYLNGKKRVNTFMNISHDLSYSHLDGHLYKDGGRTKITIIGTGHKINEDGEKEIVSTVRYYGCSNDLNCVAETQIQIKPSRYNLTTQIISSDQKVMDSYADLKGLPKVQISNKALEIIKKNGVNPLGLLVPVLSAVFTTLLTGGTMRIVDRITEKTTAQREIARNTAIHERYEKNLVKSSDQKTLLLVDYTRNIVYEFYSADTLKNKLKSMKNFVEFKNITKLEEEELLQLIFGSQQSQSIFSFEPFPGADLEYYNQSKEGLNKMIRDKTNQEIADGILIQRLQKLGKGIHEMAFDSIVTKFIRSDYITTDTKYKSLGDVAIKTLIKGNQKTICDLYHKFILRDISAVYPHAARIKILNEFMDSLSNSKQPIENTNYKRFEFLDELTEKKYSEIIDGRSTRSIDKMELIIPSLLVGLSTYGVLAGTLVPNVDGFNKFITVSIASCEKQKMCLPAELYINGQRLVENYFLNNGFIRMIYTLFARYRVYQMTDEFSCKDLAQRSPLFESNVALVKILGNWTDKGSSNDFLINNLIPVVDSNGNYCGVNDYKDLHPFIQSLPL